MPSPGPVFAPPPVPDPSKAARGGAPGGVRWQCPDCGGPLTSESAPSGPDLDRLLCASGCGRRADREGGVWRFLPEFEPPGFSRDRSDHLSEIESGHFWFPPRRRLLRRLLRRAAGGTARGASGPGSALELGCGGGSFLAELGEIFPTVVGVEAYGRPLQAAGEQAPEAVLIQGDALRTPLAPEQFDLVAALDVLEHVEPASLLGEAHRVSRPGAALLLSVPAFPALWSELDRAAGHRLRYRRRRLARELADHGWRLEHHTHYQALLFPLMLLSRRLPGGGLHRAERRPPAWAGKILGAVNEAEVRLLGGFRLPWGSSLLAIARRAS